MLPVKDKEADWTHRSVCWCYASKSQNFSIIRGVPYTELNSDIHKRLSGMKLNKAIFLDTFTHVFIQSDSA